MRLGGIATMLLCGMVLTGCAATTAVPPTASPSDGAHVDAPLARDEEHANHAEHPTIGANPEWDAPARQAALELAASAMAAYTATDRSQADWHAELAQYLTQTAADVYSTVDPARIPATGTTGEPSIVDDSSPYLARVEVATNAGPYLLILQRIDGDSPWRVDRIVPAEDEQ